jgi:hypothetical protein
MSDRYTIDEALYEAVPRGGYTKLAELRGVKLQTISKYYDPHNPERQSVFSKALLELKTISRACPEWAGSILKVFNRFGAEWCGSERPTREFNSDVESIVTIAAKLQNPQTPDVDKMPLALELQRRANMIVSGLQFEDREDAVEEIRPKRVAAR